MTKANEEVEEGPAGERAGPYESMYDKALTVSMKDLEHQLALIDDLTGAKSGEIAHDHIVNNIGLLDGLANLLSVLKYKLENGKSVVVHRGEDS